MPAATAPLIGFLLGLFFAWLSPEDLDRSGTNVSRPVLWLAVAFGALVYGPAVAYFLAAAPDWAFAYVVDTERLPRVTSLLLTLLCAGSPALGALAGSASASRKSGFVARIAAIPAIVTVAIAIGSARRLSVYATYTQYHGDFGVEPVTGSPLGYALLWSAAVLAASSFWTARQLRGLRSTARRD